MSNEGYPLSPNLIWDTEYNLDTQRNDVINIVSNISDKDKTKTEKIKLTHEDEIYSDTEDEQNNKKRRKCC